MNAIVNIKAKIRLQQWAQQVDECQKSGLSVSAWCKANGIRTNTYYYRLKQVRESTLEKLHPAADHQPEAEDTCISFKQLQVQSSVGSSRAAVIIHLPNAVLEVAPGTDQRTLETVLLALKSTCQAISLPADRSTLPADTQI